MENYNDKIDDETTKFDNNLEHRNHKALNLIRGETSERPRVDNSKRANAIDCNIKANWPGELG